MKCLILAAGRGSRLRQRAESKPLLPLLGVPLIERSIRTAMQAGADAFVVVTGYRGEAVREALDVLARRLGVPIDTVENPDWAHTENGHSILAAEGLLDEPFLMSMADHLFEPELARVLLQTAPPEHGLCLAVDGRLDNPLVDPDDVTRVRRVGDTWTTKPGWRAQSGRCSSACGARRTTGRYPVGSTALCPFASRAIW